MIDSGRSLNLLSDSFYQHLGEPSQIRVRNENIMAANNEKLPVKGSTAIQVLLQKNTSEITFEFLLTKIEIALFSAHGIHCVLNP